MGDRSMTDPVSDFPIHLIFWPVGVSGANCSAQHHTGRLPHPPADSQSLRWGFLPQDIGHVIVQHLKLE
jgi:hypothetical protein